MSDDITRRDTPRPARASPESGGGTERSPTGGATVEDSATDRAGTADRGSVPRFERTADRASRADRERTVECDSAGGADSAAETPEGRP